MNTCEDCGSKGLTDAQYIAHAGGMCDHEMGRDTAGYAEGEKVLLPLYRGTQVGIVWKVRKASVDVVYRPRGGRSNRMWTGPAELLRRKDVA